MRSAYEERNDCEPAFTKWIPACGANGFGFAATVDYIFFNGLRLDRDVPSAELLRQRRGDQGHDDVQEDGVGNVFTAPPPAGARGYLSAAGMAEATHLLPYGLPNWDQPSAHIPLVAAFRDGVWR